jgi:hypothetical protein
MRVRWRAERHPGPPDYVGVGAHGSPTTPWHALLMRHPDVVHPRGDRKALHFFDEFCARPMEDADVERYYASLARPSGAICGDWTSRYMYDHWTPALLHRVAPAAKLMMVVADPIERYRLQIGHKAAFEDLDKGDVYMVDALARGRYATQLRRLLEYYDRERILVLQYERCVADPVGEYRRMLRFLGLRDEFVPKRLRRWREGADDRELRFPTPVQDVKRAVVRFVRRRGDILPGDLWPDLEASLHEELDGEIAEFAGLAPGLDLSLWPHFAGLAAPTRA